MSDFRNTLDRLRADAERNKNDPEWQAKLRALEDRVTMEKDIERLENLGRMNIEREFHEARLDNFKASTQEQTFNLSQILRLVAGEIQQVVMVGKNGTGKTHLACAAIQVIGSGKIMTMYEISAAIRATYSGSSQKTELQIVDKLARTPILAIDEIGRTKGSDSEANWLSYIIDKRHSRGLPLVLISNKHIRKSCDKGGCPECLENYIGEDIMSRLTDGGVLLKFSGEDYRHRKG